MHPISRSRTLHLSNDGFHLRWSGESLLVPNELGALLDDLGIRSAEQFASMLISSPSALSSLDIPQTELRTAAEDAMRVLAEKLDERLLSPTGFFPSLGARRKP